MQLANRLKREVKKNPAKAIGLGVLLLVACYFWAPLIVGFVAPATPPAPPPTVEPTAAATVPAPATEPTGSTPQTITAAAYDWQRHSKGIDESELHKSAKLPNDRDPFQDLAPPPVPAVESVAEAEPAVPPITPSDAGLTLGSTLVSPRRKVAEINGKSYGINDRVEVTTDAQAVSFRIVAIHPRRVVLERDGTMYDLKIPRPLLDGIEERTGDSGESPEPPSKSNEPAAESAAP